MLTRPQENLFVDKEKADIRFLVLDELHTYRGRQGADVAMLKRRLREHCSNPKMICIGTSATMSSAKTREQRLKEIASYAKEIFGSPFKIENVIDEKLVRVLPSFDKNQYAHFRSIFSAMNAFVEPFLCIFLFLLWHSVELAKKFGKEKMLKNMSTNFERSGMIEPRSPAKGFKNFHRHACFYLLVWGQPLSSSVNANVFEDIYNLKYQ
jgi:hypothetical protein